MHGKNPAIHHDTFIHRQCVLCSTSIFKSMCTLTFPSVLHRHHFHQSISLLFHNQWAKYRLKAQPSARDVNLLLVLVSLSADTDSYLLLVADTNENWLKCCLFLNDSPITWKWYEPFLCVCHIKVHSWQVATWPGKFTEPNYCQMLEWIFLLCQQLLINYDARTERGRGGGGSEPTRALNPNR